MASKLIDRTTKYTDETIIHIESGLKIFESKNRCKMVESGYRYEKMPTWSEKEYLLDNSGAIIFTDAAIYLYVNSKTMRYPYTKIVNYGFEKIFTMNQAYFDVKTSSPFPHRFSFTDTFREKNKIFVYFYIFSNSRRNTHAPSALYCNELRGNRFHFYLVCYRHPIIFRHTFQTKKICFRIPFLFT